MTSTVPNLCTAPVGPVLKLEAKLLERQADIETWFRRQWLETPAPFYASVDLRNAGFKLAPVDTNLFPAGFNNLNPDFDPLCIHALQSAIERICPTAAGILVVPENHTRNRFYLESLAALVDLIAKAGFHVRIGSTMPDMEQDQIIDDLESGRKLRLEPLRRSGDEVYVGEGEDRFSPCAVVLNNDLSGGRPAILEAIRQPVTPPAILGWSNRLKSDHFGLYQQVAAEFAELIGIDSWLVDPLFRNCGKINFMKREGEECLVSNVEMLLEDITAKYSEYGIEEEPFVIVKADAGTYGMGVMTVKSTDDVLSLNRNARKKMASAKDGREVSGAIIQEGVYTFETWNDPADSAEPVIYMIDHYVVGGFYRVHDGRGRNENLNAPGARFQMLAFSESCTRPDPSRDPDAQPNKFYAYGVVARLALLAAAREIARAHQGD